MFATQHENLDEAMSSSRWDLLEQMTQDGPSTSQPRNKKSPIQQEVDRYLEITPRASSVDVDILKWWKSQAEDLPLLAAVAKKILAIPATSASSERLFSSGGNVVTTQRTSLTLNWWKNLCFTTKTGKKWKSKGGS
jgi:hypothetical protein